MFRLALVIFAAFALSACGEGGSGKVATTTSGNRVGTVSGTVSGSGSGGAPVSPICTQNCTGFSSTTPAAKALSSYPSGQALIEYNVNTSNQVIALGVMQLNQNFGFGNCVIPSGTYDIKTTSFGVRKTKVHHYGNIGVSIVGPKSLTGEIVNTNSMENQNGEWVQFLELKINVGANCSSSVIHFYMPLAQ